MSKKKIEEKEELTREQKEFIANKVKELNDFGAVCEFYKLNDEVSRYARSLANGEEDEENEEKKPTKIKTVKRKRKIEAMVDDE